MKSILDSLGRLNSAANHDFCPWANRYVYWLKEPVGWFVIAAGASVLVGIFLSPIGWTVAAGLAAILLLGLGFPWLAVRMTRCKLAPVQSEIHERDSAQLELTVQNRLPLPIFGLTVEGYLSQPLGNLADEGPLPDVGLSQVAAFSLTRYRLAIQPEYRGHYPAQPPKIACSFPFGIWTARRELTEVSPVTVWPMLLSATGELEIVGKRMAESGQGDRPSSHGDFMGVRDFRHGDSLRSIHWGQSAKLDQLIVCERGGPQKQTIRLELSTANCRGNAEEQRENLAWRVRIMASLVDLAVSRHLPFQLSIDGSISPQVVGFLGRRAAWDALTRIPLDGIDSSSPMNPLNSVAGGSTSIQVTASDAAGGALDSSTVRVQVLQPSGAMRRADQNSFCDIDLDKDIARQLTQLFMEVSREAYTT